MNRRSFLRTGAATAAAVGIDRLARAVETTRASAPQFHTANPRWQTAYDSALQVLAGNVQVLPHFDKPVLIEGSVYRGIWQECGPHESLVYRKFRPDVARNTHMTFFALQKPDGQIPASNKTTETGFGQIQMVVPIAATAWELARATGDDELLRAAYAACSRWDDWLMKYRNTRGTGLVEGFCTYDTGNDNSPRFAGIPNQCPNKDAKQCPPVASLPRLCPDLSATIYGQRVALAAMAAALGKSAEAEQWSARAKHLRSLILSRLYVAEDAAFYDLDAQDHFVKVRSEIITRICSEHVVDQKLFDDLWQRQIHAPAFWPAYPLPSVAIDDPKFVRPIPRNSWGGATQALTALRAGRWFDHYHRSAEFTQMMDAWCNAMQTDVTNHAPGFRQQMDPLTGVFSQEDPAGYSPCALVMLDYTWRLAGIVEEHDHLQWNVRPEYPASQEARFKLTSDTGSNLELRYKAKSADLLLNGRVLMHVEGTARVVTSKEGEFKGLVGISTRREKVLLNRPGIQRNITFQLAPNQQTPRGVEIGPDEANE
jgi:hypothetical protein